MKVIDLRSIKIIYVIKLITYLIGIISFLSVVKHIGFIYSVIFVILFLTSMYFEYKNTFYFPRWLINVFSIGIVIFTVSRINVSELVTQLVEALLMIFAIKFLEEKKPRDYMQIYTLSLFLLAGLGLLSLDITFSIYLIVVVLMLSISSVLLTFYSQEPNGEFHYRTILKILAKSLYIPCAAIPLTVVMFVILPRTQYPIFEFLNRPDKARTGFTESVRLGTVSSIQEDSSVIMRVHMDKINEELLYWRGIILDYFDGSSWKSSEKQILEPYHPLTAKGIIVKQTIYLEPYGNKYIFALDKPAYIALKDVKRLEDLSYIMPYPVEKRIRYEAISIISEEFFENSIDKSIYLQLPENISERIKDLAKNIAKGNNPLENIYAIHRFLNNGSLKYSLKNLPVSQNPLEDFLFKSKYGNCEYFASAFAVMLRIMGIPARLVGGYKGGYYNDVGRYYLIPQKHAHVWVEAYIEGKGWIRFDPTPVFIDPYGMAYKKDLLMKLRLLTDTINYYWYAFVINYNLDRQLSVVFAITRGIRKPQLIFKKEDTVYIKYGFAFIFAIAFVYYAIYVFKERQDKERLLLKNFYKKLEKYGYKKKASQGLEEFVKNIEDSVLRKKAFEFVRQFEELYYKDRRLNKGDLERLNKILRGI